MPLDTIVRIIDVTSANDRCAVVYYIEDQGFSCVWQGAAPSIGDIYLIDTACPGKDARKLAEASPQRWVHGNDAVRWRLPSPQTSGLSRMEVLRRRHKIAKAVRAYLDTQGFTEIDTPLLVHGTTPDTCIDSFPLDGRYLISSSEYQLRRLVVGGMTKVYSLTKNFRRGDQSTCRNPEFTMLEWGRAGSAMKDIENDTEAFIAEAMDALKLPPTVSYQGRDINMKAPWSRMSVAEAIERVTGASMPDFELSSCRKAALATGLNIKADWLENRDFLFSLVMDFIQPQLGVNRPVFITQWPFFQTTTASPDPDNPTLAQRSELFVAGIEIADGFGDLTDGVLQERLFRTAQETRMREGMEAVDLDEKYLASMLLGYPYGAAMALGFDRLVMLLTNQPQINSVLAFGWDEV